MCFHVHSLHPINQIVGPKHALGQQGQDFDICCWALKAEVCVFSHNLACLEAPEAVSCSSVCQGSGSLFQSLESQNGSV